jgi:geranylgeranyl diphosphate synthase, type II
MTSVKVSHPAVKILEKYKKIIWPEIDKYLKDSNYPKIFRIPNKYKKEVEYQWQIVRDYPERKGKYIRPVLVVLTALAMGVPFKRVLKTSAAMQLSEEWMLGHDDFEDNSVKRRGKPALHRIYGPELAVNAGDLLHAIMWKILADNDALLDKKTFKLILDEFHKMLLRTILGQGVEIAWTQKNISKFTDNDWYFIADGKTSYYTITHPVRLGAILGGANNNQLENLTLFGLNLGRGFQLVDDILDITSDFTGLKVQGNDIYEGKKTVILGHLLRSANRTDKQKILKIMEKKNDDKTQKEVDWVIKKMHSYGSVDYAEKLAQKYKTKALEIFEKDLKFLSKQPHRQNLRQLIDFIIEREY